MIREVHEEDLSQIRTINAISLGYEVDMETVVQQFKRCTATNHILLAFEGDHGQVLGYIHAQIYESLYSDRGLNILALAVLPNFQGKGVGNSLLQSLESYAREYGFRFIRLNSANHRKQAHLFYEKNGYLSDKQQKRFIKYI